MTNVVTLNRQPYVPPADRADYTPPVDPSMRDEQRVTLACHALWSDHPLVKLYALFNGAWVGDRYEPAHSWSTRDLIAFAHTLPDDVIRRLANVTAAHG